MNRAGSRHSGKPAGELERFVSYVSLNVSEQLLQTRIAALTLYESYDTYKTLIETRTPEVVANIFICLIHQTNYLMDMQLKQPETAFLREGGLRELIIRTCLDSRKKGNP